MVSVTWELDTALDLMGLDQLSGVDGSAVKSGPGNWQISSASDEAVPRCSNDGIDIGSK